MTQDKTRQDRRSEGTGKVKGTGQGRTEEDWTRDDRIEEKKLKQQVQEGGKEEISGGCSRTGFGCSVLSPRRTSWRATGG
eukprot:748000-Hanusia_phi.AAC.1